MQTIYVSADTAFFGSYGHMQIVYDDGTGTLVETEVQAPGDLGAIGGNWDFRFNQSHNVPEGENYGIYELELQEGQTAEYVWELLGQIHDSLVASSATFDIDYDTLSSPSQNSNSYVRTLLEVIGNTTDWSMEFVADGMDSFPGYARNVLLDLNESDVDGLPLNVAGTAGNDIIIAGVNTDSIGGSGGNDTLSGGEGNDTLSGGEGEDMFLGAPSELNGDTINDIEIGDRIGVSGSVVDPDSLEAGDSQITFSAGASGTVAITATVPDGATLVVSDETLEDGGSIIEVVPSGGQDIAFVIDTTGSMFDDIAAVQASASAILDALFDEPGSRAAIVTFNDFGFPASTDANNADVLLPFTSDIEAVREAINAIDVFGGGDFPEYTFEGLYLALSGAAGEWREDADDRKIVLFGDAIAKDPELAAAVFALAADLDATIDVSFAESDGVHATKMTLRVEGGASVEIYAVTTGSPGADVVAEFTEIAESTGGAVFDAEDPDDLVSTIIEIIEIEEDPEVPEPVLELVRGTTSSDELIGSDGGDLIKGFQGDDLLVGQAGADELRAGKGDDIVFGGRGGDFMTGGQGEDLLNGGAGSDTMLGGQGDDTIVMGEGLDIATGGQGADTFVFTDATTDGRNVITDLSLADGDMIDLTEFGLSWLGGDRFSGEGMQVRFREDTDRIMVDLDGDNRTDFYIQLEDGYTAADVEAMLVL